MGSGVGGRVFEGFFFFFFFSGLKVVLGRLFLYIFLNSFRSFFFLCFDHKVFEISFVLGLRRV